MKRQNQNKKTIHHIVPTSRLQGKGVLNVCKVPAKQHDLYHRLYGNMTPFEIIEFMNHKIEACKGFEEWPLHEHRHGNHDK